MAPLLKFATLLLATTFCGCTLAFSFRTVLFLGERLLLGIVLGLVAFISLSFCGSLALGFETAILVGIFTLMLMVTGAAILAQRASAAFGSRRLTPAIGRAHLRLSKTDAYAGAVFLTSLVLFIILMNRLVIWHDGALATGYLDAWGDLPYHTSLIMSFVNQSILNLNSTTVAGQPLVYPFMPDFFSAILIRFGIPLEYAMEWPAILLNSVTTTLLFYLSYRLTKNLQAALLVPVLFVFAGGLGFLWFFQDIFFATRPVWELLQDLPRRYTNMPEFKVNWINPTLAHLIPQRSFLFGFPIGLSVILFWWTAFKARRPKQGWVPGIFLGLLPLFHTHTLLTLTISGALFFLFSCLRKTARVRHLRYWLTMGGVALTLALPQILYILSSNVSTDVIRPHPGWMADAENLLWFWLKNLGGFIPLLLIALLIRKRLKIRKRAILFYLPFGAIFVVLNLFSFSAFAYDNNKMLIYWFLLSLPFVAQILVTLYRCHSWWLRAFTFRVLLISLTLSGALNLLHELQRGPWTELSAEEVQLAAQISARMSPEAVFLTAPVHNNLLALTGNSVVLGYPGHVFSHGLDYVPIEKAVRQIYAGTDSGRAELTRLDVDYIVVGPHERERFNGGSDRFAAEYETVLTSENYAIYDVQSARPGRRVCASETTETLKSGGLQ